MVLIKQAVLLATATLVLLAASASAETETAAAASKVTGTAAEAVTTDPGVMTMAVDAANKAAVDEEAAEEDPTAVKEVNDVEDDADVDGVSRGSRYGGYGHGHGYRRRRWCKHYKVCRKYRIVSHWPCHYRYSSHMLKAGAKAAAEAEPEEAAPMEADGVETADGEVLTGAAERGYDGGHRHRYGHGKGYGYGKGYGKHYRKYYCYKVRCHYKRKCYYYRY